jgi:heme/copper-type cytochrome/quinol oxidase subunit 2
VWAVLLDTASAAVLPLIDQPNASQPPGAEKLVKILNWGMWLVIFAAIIGVFITAAMMAVSYNQGRGGDHLGRLGYVLAGCVLAGAAAGIVNGLI